MDSYTLAAEVLVSQEVYASLPKRQDRVRECVAAAASAMDETASEQGRILAGTPHLVDQQDTGLGFVRLEFQAETAKR